MPRAAVGVRKRISGLDLVASHCLVIVALGKLLTDEQELLEALMREALQTVLEGEMSRFPGAGAANGIRPFRVVVVGLVRKNSQPKVCQSVPLDLLFGNT